MGRIDHQVKILGHRIELGDVEHGVAQLPRVHQSVVIASNDSAGRKQLVAYVVCDPNCSGTPYGTAPEEDPQGAISGGAAATGAATGATGAAATATGAAAIGGDTHTQQGMHMRCHSACLPQQR